MIDALSLQVVELFKTVQRDILAPHHGRVCASAMASKADASLVTAYDRESERALTIGLKALTPGADVIGEEEIDADPRAFARIEAAGPLWIIDPIDGTGAFARGEYTYGITGAFLESGQTTRGFIYIPGPCRPARQPGAGRDELFVVSKKGKGCFLNGQQVTFATRPRLLQAARVSFACRNQDRHFEQILAEGIAGYMPRNNAAFDYASLLRGDRDAVFYSEGRTSTGAGKCPPWDHAAGVLSIQEAGGCAALPYAPEGIPYAPTRRYDQLLIASSPVLWRQLYCHVHSIAPDLCTPRCERSYVYEPTLRPGAVLSNTAERPPKVTASPQWLRGCDGTDAPPASCSHRDHQ